MDLKKKTGKLENWEKHCFDNCRPVCTTRENDTRIMGNHFQWIEINLTWSWKLPGFFRKKIF